MKLYDLFPDIFVVNNWKNNNNDELEKMCYRIREKYPSEQIYENLENMANESHMNEYSSDSKKDRMDFVKKQGKILKDQALRIDNDNEISYPNTRDFIHTLSYTTEHLTQSHNFKLEEEKEMQPLLKFAEDSVKEIEKRLDMDDEPCYMKYESPHNCFFNIQAPGCTFYDRHNHLPYKWTLIYYVKMDTSLKTGALMLFNPSLANLTWHSKNRGNMDIDEISLDSYYKGDVKMYFPKPGDLVIFPAYISHTGDFYSEKAKCDRIAIPINI